MLLHCLNQGRLPRLWRRTQFRIGPAPPIPDAVNNDAAWVFAIKNLVWAYDYFANPEMDRMALTHSRSRTNFATFLAYFLPVAQSCFRAGFLRQIIHDRFQVALGSRGKLKPHWRGISLPAW